MFTGLVRAVGRLESCSAGVRILGDLTGLGPLALGDSIAVDGVCLTVAERLGGGGAVWQGFRADVSGETLNRSALAERAAASALVNLEPALRLSDRLGGHLVSGHVDGLGRVCAIRPGEAAWHLELGWNDPAYGRYICEKASIAVDGISLTVAGCQEGGASFWIAVIPHTWQSTTLAQRRVGDRVNLEADLLAKYTERLLQGRLPTPPQTAAPQTTAPQTTAMQTAAAFDAAWLAEHGWGLPH